MPDEIIEDLPDTVEVENIVEDDNVLEMSDEDFRAAMLKGLPDMSEESSAEEEPAEEKEPPEEQEETEEGPLDSEADEGSSEEKEETEEETEEEEEEKEPASAEDQLKELFTPFKANGKDIRVDNIADVRQLMQMGANYNKKMAALKPNLKVLKMLENHGLLDEGKLSFLIDIDKKDPTAIAKLIKESGIDPDDLDNDDKVAYKPNTYTVNDKEVELDETLNDIRDTKSYAQTLDIIGNKWDASSKEALLQNPAGIRVLNDHIQSGIYDKIASVVETERMFNRIPSSMSDLEAYRHVGDMINARGGFQAQPGSTSQTKTVRSKTTKQVVDPKLSDRKKAASSTRSKPKSVSSESFNPLAMSDEEFAKVGMNKFLT